MYIIYIFSFIDLFFSTVPSKLNILILGFFIYE